ncbi:unnamed protein product, partial [Mesorhabditis spiculigera]
MYSVVALATQILVSVHAVGDVRHISITGDLVLGGVFPVHWKAQRQDGDPCGAIAETRGVHRVEAMLYALDVINSQQDFLRGYKLGALILDSCSNPAYALNQSLDFVRELIGSTEPSEYQCHDGSPPTPKQSKMLQTRRNVVAVVGGSYSSVTVQVANLLRLFRIVQVSPASTNADLSDKARFEFFARTVPSDNYQVRAMISIAKEFGWTYISLLYSADEYGELGAEAFKKEARKENICIATEERVLNKKESISESIDNLIKKLQPEKKVGARVVVLFVGTEYVAELMNQAAEKMKLQKNAGKKKLIWLASEGWDRNNEAYIQGQRKLAAQGAIVLMLSSQRVPSFEDYFLKLHPGSEQFERNKWLRELWMSKFDCEFDLPDQSTRNRCEDQRNTPDSFTADDKVQYVIDAVYALAHALRSYKDEVCPEENVENNWVSRKDDRREACVGMENIDGGRLYHHLLKVKFDDLVGKKVHFTKEGDGPASYTILNYQPASMSDKQRRDKMDLDTFRSDYVEIGSWSEGQLEIQRSKLDWGDDVPLSICSMPCQKGYRKQLIKDEICCWACSKCEDYEYLVNETFCLDCGPGWWPNADRKSCFNIAERNLKHMKWRSWYSIVPAIFASLGIGTCIFIILVFMKHNDTPVVKASGRELCYILLIAMIMCYMMTFVLLARPVTWVCGLKRTGIGFAFSCLYSAMLVKTNRIARIFSQATRSAVRPGCISPISQVLLTCFLAGLQLLGSLCWLAIVPPGTRHIYPTRDQVVLTCNVPDHHFLYSLAYDAGLIVLTTVYAVQTRKVPENFNETKWIAFSMYTTCVLWVSWIFFFFGTGTDYQIQTSSLCISISMSANVVLVCIFSPKLWIILVDKHKNVRKQDGEYMLAKRSNTSNIHGPALQNTNTLSGVHGEAEPTPYTALLGNDKRKTSRRITPPSCTNSSAQDTFL